MVPWNTFGTLFASNTVGELEFIDFAGVEIRTISGFLVLLTILLTVFLTVLPGFDSERAAPLARIFHKREE